MKTVLFFSLFIFLGVSDTWALQDDPGLAWYESFFQTKKGKPTERVIDEATAAIKRFREEGATRDEIKALKTLGLLHLTQTQDVEKSLDLFIQAAALEDSSGIKDEQVFTFMAIARVFEKAGNFARSEEFLQDALNANAPSKNPHRLVRILHAQGNVNAAMGKLEEAFENYRMMLEYKDVVDDPRIEAQALGELAHLYVQQIKYPEALTHYKKALAISRSLRDKRNEAQSLNDIGELYMLMKNVDKALANHLVALQIRKSLNIKKEIAASYNNIGAIYFEQQHYARAITNLSLGLEAAQASNDQLQIQKSADLLSRGYKIAGDYKKALEYQELLLNITEFIQHDYSERQLVDRQNQYTLGKKEIEIDKLEVDREKREKEIEHQKQITVYLSIVAFFVVITAGLVFSLYISKRKSNQELAVVNQQVKEQNVSLQELNATKDKFFSIISHDLKGPLNSLTSFSSLLINHSESLSKEEIKMLAQDLDKSLKNLFALLENLLEWSRSQTGNIEFTPAEFDLAAVLETNKELLKAQAQNKSIQIVNERQTPLNARAHKNSINTVVRNLISNAIKFTPANGLILVNAQTSSTFITVSIADNGVGMSPEIMQKLFRIDTKHSTKGTAEEKGTGLGLILCKEFVEKNGGRIWVESEIGKGSVFYFTIPGV